jgi:hypothetical protein
MNLVLLVIQINSYYLLWYNKLKSQKSMFYVSILYDYNLIREV